MDTAPAAIQAWWGRVTALTTYIFGLSAVALAVFALLLNIDVGVGNVWVVVGLAALAALAERGNVRLTATTEVSICLVPTLFAAVLFGPLAGLLVGAASNLADLVPKDRSYLKWVTYTSSRSITGAATGTVALGASSLIENPIGAIVLATCLAALTAEGLDIGFAAMIGRLRTDVPVRAVLRTMAPLALAPLSLYAPVVAVLAVAFREVSPWSLALFLAPAIAAQRLYVLYQRQRGLTEDVLSANERLERANLSFATALVATLDARDRYTAGHSAAVSIYARDIAARMALPEYDQRLAHLCGLVHDIGKIGLPAGLLEKEGPLTLLERRQMEQHSEIGERILRNVEDYAEIASIVRHHHERVDGHGYPDGLHEEEIPLVSRIIAVADAYDAMTSDRPYRDAMPSRVARLRLAQAVGSQFDTSVVAAFEAILAGANEEYRFGRGGDFRREAEVLAAAGSSDPGLPRATASSTV